MFEECFGNGPFIFRINENGTGPPLLTQVWYDNCLWQHANTQRDYFYKTHKK